MGMFADKEYLTGDNGLVKTGEEFVIHSAELGGEVTINGEQRREAKFDISLLTDPTAHRTVYTTGRGIVNQVERMNAEDQRNMPFVVRLAERPPARPGQNPMNLLEFVGPWTGTLPQPSQDEPQF